MSNFLHILFPFGFNSGFRTVVEVPSRNDVHDHVFGLPPQSSSTWVIGLSRENSFILCLRIFLNSFHIKGNLSKITTNWNCSCQVIPLLIISWAIFAVYGITHLQRSFICHLLLQVSNYHILLWTCLLGVILLL